jgi:hypothetical protein
VPKPPTAPCNALAASALSYARTHGCTAGFRLYRDIPAELLPAREKGEAAAADGNPSAADGAAAAAAAPAGDGEGAGAGAAAEEATSKKVRAGWEEALKLPGHARRVRPG